MYSQKTYENKKRHVWFYLSALGIVLCLLFYLSIRMYILTLEERVHELMGEHEILVKELENLDIEAAELRTSSRIIRIAREELGMELPVGAPERLF